MNTPPPRPRVLFVDDDRHVRETWEYCFGEEFEATVVATGAEALELLADPPDGVPFDVLVADHRMPGMTGAELCWKAREVAPETARIIVTGFRDREAHMCPCRAVLDKPGANGKLETVIRQAANGEAATEEDVRRREREAEEALREARQDFRETTEKLKSWQPPPGVVKVRS